MILSSNDAPACQKKSNVGGRIHLPLDQVSWKTTSNKHLQDETRQVSVNAHEPSTHEDVYMFTYVAATLTFGPSHPNNSIRTRHLEMENAYSYTKGSLCPFQLGHSFWNWKLVFQVGSPVWTCIQVTKRGSRRRASCTDTLDRYLPEKQGKKTFRYSLPSNRVMGCSIQANQNYILYS